ncbi:uncharacterized protein [Choristoneura fumiferana]|uniref:uncharacterized protein n=1 Tax=Choristoneura fumiferana TaxID=7141 RepID=UPI003D1560C2
MPAATKNIYEVKLNAFENESDCHSIKPKHIPCRCEIDECDEIFENEEEMKRSLARFCRGDFFIIGRIWIAALKTVLVGEKLCLISKVDAACVQAATLTEPKPKKPPDMKYTDLPLYDSPHKNYKDHLEDKYDCPKSHKKVLQTLLLPYVRCYRKKAQRILSEARCELKGTCNEISCDFRKAKKQVRDYLRDPQNVELRTGIVALGAGLGYYFGSGKGLPRRMFWTSFGAAVPGMICFPKETDAAIREVCWLAGNAWVALCKNVLNRDWDLRDKIPCPPPEPEKPPPPPPPIKIDGCPEKK